VWLSKKGSRGSSRRVAASAAVRRWRDDTKSKHSANTTAVCSARSKTCRCRYKIVGHQTGTVRIVVLQQKISV